MTRTFLAGLACVALLLSLSGCEDDPPPLVGTASYSTCVGSYPGTCAEDCCASENEHYPISPDPRASCQVTPAEGDNYRLNFAIASPDGDTAIEGIDILYSSTATNPAPVRACGEFLIFEEGNEYSSDDCNGIVDGSVVTDSCAVLVNSDGETVRGTFTCNELQLPGQPLRLSTIYSGGIGAGSFEIQNCDFRL